MRYSFDLDCGRSVTVEALYYQRTYLGLFVGLPNQTINDEIVARARTEMAPLWGERRTYVMPPAVNASDPEHPILPRLRFTAWLCSFQPIKEPNAGSELVVVWFQEECGDERLEKIVHDAIRSLAWDELAQDFEGW